MAQTWAPKHNEIATGILIHLGKVRGADLANPRTPEEQSIVAIWSSIRRELLESMWWKFAKKRIDLGDSQGTPAFGYAYQFLLPDDYILPVSVNEHPITKEDWTEENGYMLLNTSTCTLEYIADIEETTFWSPLFLKCFKLRCAYEVAYALKANLSLTQNLMQRYILALTEAKWSEGQRRSYRNNQGGDLIDGR